MNFSKRVLRYFTIAAAAWLLNSGIYAIEIRSVRTLDSLRSQRSNFSSTENITFACETYSAEAVSRVNFTFVVYDPSGAQIFRHTGNSIPGAAGIGGSQVGNVPLSSLYTNYGNFTLEVTATPDTGAPAAGRATFSVYSPIITLSYPANGALDLIDQPLVFRWIASGASRYRIYVDDDQSFYNTLFTDYTQDTFFSYPLNPTDTRQKLASGTQYYWKVEGLDAAGNRVAQSPTPFSFTLKQSGSTSSTKDIAIAAIEVGRESSAPQLNVNVEVKNLGGSAENNITVTLYIGGVVYGTKKIDLISSGEILKMEFNLTLPDLAPGQPIFASASHNFYDDNIRNNILTQSLAVKDSYFRAKLARIIGRIKDAVDGKAVTGAKIAYSGPRSGETMSKDNGQYKIEDLTEGSYQLKVMHPKYMTEELAVNIEKGKAYPQIDFELLGEAGKARFTLAEIWEIMKPYISRNILDKLEGYAVYEIKGAGEEELNSITVQLRDKKAKVTEAEAD